MTARLLVLFLGAILCIVIVFQSQRDPDVAAWAERIEQVTFGDVQTAEVQRNQVLVIWDHGDRYSLSRLEDEMGDVICHLRDHVNDALPYRLLIKIDVVDDSGNVSAVNGILGVFDPEVYNGLNCTNETLFDLAAIARTWDVHETVD